MSLAFAYFTSREPDVESGLPGSTTVSRRRTFGGSLIGATVPLIVGVALTAVAYGRGHAVAI
jgi:hypothetical protein